MATHIEVIFVQVGSRKYRITCRIELFRIGFQPGKKSAITVYTPGTISGAYIVTFYISLIMQILTVYPDKVSTVTYYDGSKSKL